MSFSLMSTGTAAASSSLPTNQTRSMPSPSLTTLSLSLSFATRATRHCPPTPPEIACALGSSHRPPRIIRGGFRARIRPVYSDPFFLQQYFRLRSCNLCLLCRDRGCILPLSLAAPGACLQARFNDAVHNSGQNLAASRRAYGSGRTKESLRDFWIARRPISGSRSRVIR